MKAIIYREHGSPDVLAYEDIDKPAPEDDQVLIRVRAASVNPLDWHMMRGLPGVQKLVGSRQLPRRLCRVRLRGRVGRRRQA